MDNSLNRRRLLQRLGLVVGAVYVARVVMNISDARAASGPSGGDSGGGGGSSGPDTASAPSAPSAPSVPSTPSAPSGATDSEASLLKNGSCSDVLGRSVSCN
jgi:hypothetical protein